MNISKRKYYSYLLFLPLILIFWGFILGIIVIYKFIASNSTNSFFHNLPFTRTAFTDIAKNTTIAYIKNDEHGNSVWMYDFNTHKSIKLPIDTISAIYHNPHSPWVFYQSNKKQNTINGFNINSHTLIHITIANTSSYQIIAQLPPDEKILIDEKYLLYSVIYSAKDCKEISCADTDPKTEGRRGMYVYNIQEQTSTYLGDFSINNSTNAGNKIIVQDVLQAQNTPAIQNNLYQINLANGDATKLSQNIQRTDSGQILNRYYLDRSKSTLNLEITRGKNAIITMQNNLSKSTILSLVWYRIQSSIWLSPSQNYILYLKESSYKNGFTTYERDIYSIETKKTIHLYNNIHIPDPINDEYWIDTNHFILLDNKNIFLIDITSNYKKQLIYSSNISLFNPLPS